MADDIPGPELAPDPAAVTDPDAETVGRVASLLAEHRWGGTLSGDIARLVLADLRERYILVPRDGASEGVEWGEQNPGTGHVYGGAGVSEDSVRISAEVGEQVWAVMRRPVVHGPWEPAP